jgi:N-acetylneuraminic acid mutarotase
MRARSVTVVMLTIAVASVLVGVTTVHATVGSRWRVGRSMPKASQHAGGATLGGKLYVIGGEDEHVVMRTVQRFNPSTGRWTKRAELPTRRTHVAAVGAGSRLYAIAGTSVASIPTPSVYRYDPRSNSWRKRDPLPIALTGVAAAAAPIGGNDVVFVFGGLDAAGNARDTTYAYDTSANSWTTMSPMPAPLSDASAVQVDGTIFVLGGFDSEHAPSVAMFAYDVASDTWTDVASMRTNVFGAVGATAGGDGRIYAIAIDSSAQRVDAYDPTLDVWTTTPPNLQHSQAYAATGRIRSRIYAAGGNPASLTLTSETLESLLVK